MMNTMQRIALITGANKGIGLETARQLGQLGFKVLIGCRNLPRGQEAAGKLAAEKLDAQAIELDVTSDPSIKAAADRIEREFGWLDVLVNNAGMGAHGEDGPASTTPVSAIRRVFETNYFGLVAVTQAMLPLIRKSAAGRIVNVSSILGSLAEHADPNSTIYRMKMLAYSSSKTEVNVFTQHLAWELRNTKIKVNAAHPGWVKTDLGGPQAPLEVTDGAKTSVRLATLPDSGPSGGFYHMDTHLRW